jgi:alpha-D-xyloside xylohydrolase
MARPNCIIAVGKIDNKPDYDFADGVTFHIFELTDGGQTGTGVFGMDGKFVMDISAKLAGKEITIVVTASNKPWHALLRGITGFKSVKGAAAEICAEGLKLTPDKGGSTIVVTLP